VFAFYPNKQMATGEGGVVDDALRGGVAAASQPAQPGPLVRRRRLVPPRPARPELPLDGRAGGDRARTAREARPDPRAAAAAAARYGELLADVDGVEPPAPDDAEQRRSWFVYVVKLDARSTATR
jgi:perosamine synthetase